MHMTRVGPASTMTISLLAAFLVATAGCRDKAPGPSSTIEIPEILVDSPEWNGVGDDDVVASIGEIQIPAWRVRRALAAAEPGVDPEQVLDSVIVEELVARKAAAGKGFTPDRKTFEKALAARYLQKKTVEDLQPEDVPMEMLKETFAIPQVWAKFNHVDLYEVQDYQWICCTDPASCDSAVTEACLDAGAEPMAAVSRELEKDRPDPADLPILAPRYQTIAGHLTYQEYSFAFDHAKGHQKGLTHIDSALATEVMKIKPGEYTVPVRSKFGWHIARLSSHKPEERRDLSDPEVRKEIATVFIQRFRQDAFLRMLAGLVGHDRLKLLQIYFENRTPPGTTPTYDVRVFHNELRDAAAVQTEKEGEPLPQF